MKHPHSNWKSFGLLAGILMLAAGLQAQDTSTVVRLIATDPTALEGTTTGAFTLVRNGDTNSDLTVDVDISGTASNGVDYVQIGNALTIPAGYLAIDVPVQPIPDTTNRGNKTVILTLETNGTYVIKGSHKATVKIVDDIFNLPPPTVSLTNPVDGSVFTAPATVTLQAEVSDPELPIRSVSFYANDDLLAKVTNSPYAFVWKNPHVGDYALFARAVDEFGKSAVSAPVDIVVSEVPVVTLSLPNDSTNVVIGQFVPLLAQIGDTNEPIQSASFYLNGKLLGTSTNAPFEFDWQPLQTGSFTLQATAIDKNTGKKGSSEKVEVSVMPGGGN